MAITLAQSDPDFEQRFAAFLATKREFSPEVDDVVRDIIAGCAPRATPRSSTNPEIRPGRSRGARHRGLEGRHRRRLCRRPIGNRRGADIRARPHRRASPAAEARGRPLCRSDRRRARLALDGDRGGRPLRAGRHGELSELGADERGAGQGRRRRAHGHRPCRRPAARSTRWCWSPPISPACRRSTGSAARRRSPPSPMARKRSGRSPRSSGPAMPMSPRPSGRCSAPSAST